MAEASGVHFGSLTLLHGMSEISWSANLVLDINWCIQKLIWIVYQPERNRSWESKTSFGAPCDGSSTSVKTHVHFAYKCMVTSSIPRIWKDACELHNVLRKITLCLNREPSSRIVFWWKVLCIEHMDNAYNVYMCVLNTMITWYITYIVYTYTLQTVVTLCTM